MIPALLGIQPHLKVLHILALSVWCAGLVGLPVMLARHDPAGTQDDYRRIRRATHMTYTYCVTPAAVGAVVAGGALIFVGDVFVPWLYLKLAFVALLVGVHAWVGHVIVIVAETGGRSRPPEPHLPVVAALTPTLVILGLVLAKPDLGGIEFPEWLTTPRGGQFPFEVPRR